MSKKKAFRFSNFRFGKVSVESGRVRDLSIYTEKKVDFLFSDRCKKDFLGVPTYTLTTIYPNTTSHLRISGIVSYRSLNKLNKRKVNTLG